MDGELLKWTNYWNGWQPRWFILNDGVLSYYKSLEDVGQGCKGSINVASCEIQLHPTDLNRLDLCIPGEQHIYVRAASEKERQKWLIALGSSKACLQQNGGGGGGAGGGLGKRPSSPLSSNGIQHGLVRSNNKDNTGGGANGCSSSSVSSVTDRGAELKTKRSELRLYCDMIMQQVHSIRSAANKSDAATPDLDTDIETMDEGSRNLVQTCDAFVQVMDEIMELSEATHVFAVASNRVGDSYNDMQGGGGSGGSRRTAAARRSRTASITSAGGGNDALHSGGVDGGFQSLFANGDHLSLHIPEEEAAAATASKSVATSPRHPSLGLMRVTTPPPSMSPTTPHVGEMPFELPFKIKFPKASEGSKAIPTKDFVEASTEAIKLFDLLDAKAFSPIKIDIQGNIESLLTKLNSNPKVYSTLESIVSREANCKKAHLVTSGSNALLWITRSLMFTHNFLRRLIESLWSVERCLVTAYEETLGRHHGLVVKSVFSVAIRRSPNRCTLLDALGLPKECPERDQQRFFQSKMVPALAEYLDAMEAAVAVSIHLLHENGVDSQ